MLKSEKNKNAEKNATTSKFGKFFTHKKGHFGTKSSPKVSLTRSDFNFLSIIVFKI
jgi:hypothetical protein